eukprot:3740424-Rhodomonas_salina.1
MESLNTAEGKAWEKAHNKLIKLSQETSTLTLDMVQQVVKLAENHLASIDSDTLSRSSTDDLTAASALATDTQAAAATSGLEEQVTIQA